MNIFETITLIVLLKSKFITCDYEKKPFDEICRTEVYVDKSSIIHRVLQSSPSILITAPPRFGKSCNVKLLKHFFELEVNSTGRITRVNYKKDAVNDTNNYKLFVENGLNITKNKEIMKKHFGKYPVIFIELMAYTMSYKDVIEQFRIDIREPFMEHQYLLNSSCLNNKHKSLYTQWTQKFDYTPIVGGLPFLAKCLYKYHKMKTIVIIDQFDWYISYALFWRDFFRNEFEDILSLYSSIIIEIMKSIDRYVERIIMHGTSWYISDLVLNVIRKIKSYPFLQNTEFSNYYGFTEGEVQHLVKINKVDSKIVANITNFCNGFMYKKKKIYQPNSVMTTIRFKEIVENGYSCFFITKLLTMRKAETSVLQSKLISLIQGREINMTRIPHLRMNNTLDLMDRMRSVDYVLDDSLADVYLSFLLEQGYLTNIAPQNNTKYRNNELQNLTVKITNWELRDFLTEYIYT